MSNVSGEFETPYFKALLKDSKVFSGKMPLHPLCPNISGEFCWENIHFSANSHMEGDTILLAAKFCFGI